MVDSVNLTNAGLRTTLPRRLILNILESSAERHLGAEDIYRALHEAGEEIGLATVYRVLTQFEQSGLVLRHRFDGDKSYYELNDERHHDHMVCVKCGRVFEFVDAAIEIRQNEVAESAGFVLQDHSLHLYGICKGMQANGVCTMPKEGDGGIYQVNSE